MHGGPLPCTKTRKLEQRATPMPSSKQEASSMLQWDLFMSGTAGNVQWISRFSVILDRGLELLVFRNAS
jgi:hypothetical protein